MTLHIATYNIWFGELGFEIRARAVFDILRSADLDVIALQEVTPQFLHLLRKQAWAANYLISAESDAEVSDYGTILMSRLPSSTFERVKLWSYQGRHINLLRTESGLCIGTVHLESRSTSQEIRITQLGDIFTTFGSELTALMGDFNFDTGSEEENDIPEIFYDAWTLRSASDGFTYDTKTNHMAAGLAQRDKRVRYDRIWINSNQVDVQEICRIGLDRIPESENLWPSDHFGLSASLRSKDEKNCF